jgi:hypothetical protein
MPRSGGDGVKLGELVDPVGQEAVYDSTGVYCTARVASRSWRLHIAEGLRAEDDVAFVIATDALAPRRLAAARDFLSGIAGRDTAPVESTPARTRSALVHCDMLQALDGEAAGVSQRDIAIALRGRRDVAARWSSDGELRARVRYLLRRGRALVLGEYRTLIYQ